MSTRNTTGEDIAWVEIPLPYTAEEIEKFCQDVIRILRINPFYEFSCAEMTAPNRYKLAFFNQSNQHYLETEAATETQPGILLLQYQQGIKTASRFETTGKGLKIVDDYSGTPEDERQKRLEEVDRSLIPWAQAIQNHLRWRRRLAWIPGWTAFLDKIWLMMKPRNRRFSMLMLIISLAEVVIFGAVLIVYLSLT